MPDDRSVYGIVDLVGNIKEWCLNDFAEGGRIASGQILIHARGSGEGAIEVRGGGWHSSDYVARPAARFGPLPENRYNMLGFRLATRWPPPR